jgi:hypothetical protein
LLLPREINNKQKVNIFRANTILLLQFQLQYI